MKITIELEKEDYDYMHDIIFDVFGTEPTNEEIQGFWDMLPEEIKEIAIQWGCNDTVFRDDMYVWLQKVKKEYK